MLLRRALLLSFFVVFLSACGAPAAPTEEPLATSEYSSPAETQAPAPTQAPVFTQASGPLATATLRPPQSLPTATLPPPASRNTSTPTAAFLILPSPTAGAPIGTLVGPIFNTPVSLPTVTALPDNGGGGPTVTPVLIIPATGGGSGADPVALVEDRMAEINSQLTSGRLAYDPPERLAVGESVLLTVGLVPLIDQTAPEADATLAVELDAPVEDLETVTISTSLAMEAELSGPEDAFLIRPVRANPRQIVVTGEVTEWAWEVTALRPGTHKLTLTVSVVLDVGGETETRSKTYESDISVAVDAGITGRYLFSRYWVPLLALGLAAGGSGTFFTVRQLRFRDQKRSLMAALAAAPPTAGQKFIFMSYSHRDERFAIPLARGLMDKGIRIWIDQKEIIAGEDWTEQLKVGLSATEALLVVISPRSMASRWVMQEVAAAQASGKPVFPVMYKTVDLPENLTKIHFVDFRSDFPTALETLAGNLEQAGFKGQ